MSNIVAWNGFSDCPKNPPHPAHEYPLEFGGHEMKFIPAVLLLATVSIHVFGGDSVKELKAGDAAPDVTATDESGKEVKLSSFKDKSGVVIFFFPKAFTGG